MIGLVACSKTKLDRPAPAHALYTSPLFKLSLTYALRTCERVYILSARYHLVCVDQPLKPYDRTVVAMSRDERERWGRCIARSLWSLHGIDVALVGLTFLAGDAYVSPIKRGLLAIEANTIGVTTREPLRGMQIGERLCFLKRELTEAA